MKSYKKYADNTAMFLSFVGGVNWGLVGLFQLNLVELIPLAWLVKTIYVLVGVSALWLGAKWFAKLV